MKRLSTWDTYVQEAKKKGDRSIELPLTDDEVYVINYPTRRQGREMAKAQLAGDTEALLIALLGKDAGTRVIELAEDQPGYVLDEFLVDVTRKFGMVPDDDGSGDETGDVQTGEDSDAASDSDTPVGKSDAPTSKKPSKRLSTVSS